MPTQTRPLPTCSQTLTHTHTHTHTHMHDKRCILLSGKHGAVFTHTPHPHSVWIDSHTASIQKKLNKLSCPFLLSHRKTFPTFAIPTLSWSLYMCVFLCERKREREKEITKANKCIKESVHVSALLRPPCLCMCPWVCVYLCVHVCVYLPASIHSVYLPIHPTMYIHRCQKLSKRPLLFRHLFLHQQTALCPFPITR